MNPETVSIHTGFRVRSGAGALGSVAAQLRRCLPELVSGSEEHALVLLAVEEAVVNVLEHGYRNAEGRPLSVRLRGRGPGRFEVILRDRAPVVDVTRIPPGDLKELARMRASRGRGLAMIRLIVGSLAHAPRPGGGNDLVLAFDTARLTRVIQEHLRDAA